MFGQHRIKPIMQGESHECILACMAMVAHFHGRAVRLRDLRARFPGLSRGGTLRDLLEIARSLGFGPRAVKVELPSLHALQLPCIVHWGFNHFVVLERVRRKSVTVVDPATGRRSIDITEFSGHFTGIAAELLPLPSFESTQDFHGDAPKRRPLLPAAEFATPIAQFILVSFAVLAFSLISPLAVQIVVDEVIQKNDYDLLLVVAGAFLVSNIMGALATYIQGYHVLKHSSKTRIAVTFDYLDRLMGRDWAYFGRRNLGGFVAQYNSLNFLVSYVIKSIGSLISDCIFVLVISAVLFFIDPLIALVVLALNVMIVAVRVLLLNRARKLQDEQVRDAANEEAFFVETMRGVSSVKANQLEVNRAAGGMDRTVKSVNSGFSLALFGLRYGLFMQILKAAEVITVLYLLALNVMKGSMTVGVMYAFYSYRQFLDQRLTSLVDALGDVLNVRVHQERLADLMVGEKQTEHGTDIGGSMKFAGRLELKGISYRIDNRRKTVFSQFSRIAEEGSFVHVKGPTGSGKTTLLKIILNTVEPDEGAVFVDGTPITRSNVAVLRNSVGVVLQEDLLFSGTILENVALFDEMLDFDRVQECCRVSLIHDDIAKLPVGYQSFVGDMGSNLSTGQQQRLLLARALYKNPTILVLDEATANLNGEIEDELLGNIKSLGKTTIFASHSSRVRKYADAVWDLGAGQ